MSLPLEALILEDSAADAELLVRELKAAGFAPLKVRHCDGERGFLAALDPPPDLVLADYQLPQFTGLDALRLLRDRAPDVPFILVSGSIDEEIAGLALREGAADFVLKDRLARLGAAVERALEQKRVRDEQRRNQDEVRRLAAIVESSQDAILSRALDGKIFSWNVGAERLYGYTAAEAIGRDISLILPPERRHEPTENWRLLSRGEAVPPYETVRMTKDGRQIHVSLSLSPIKDAQGNVTGVAGISRDLSVLRRAEQELRKQVALAQLLESLARAANEAVTPEAAMQACLEHICRHGGWVLAHVGTVTPGRAVGVPQHSVWHTPDPERFAEFTRYSDRVGHTGRRGLFVGKALREKRPVWIADVSQIPGVSRLSYAAQAGIKAGFAFPVIVRDEAVAYLEFFAEETREPDQMLMEAMTSAASQLARVIERTSAEHTRARLAAIVESSSDAVVSRGLDGIILSWNAGAERIFGWSAAEVVGRPITIVSPPERGGRVRALIERILDGETVEPFETTHLRKDGTRIATAMTLSPVRDGQGGVVYIAETMRDITRQKQLEREAQQKTAITALMESLARAANEAESPEAAMQTCLARICEHGRWIVGHVMHLAPRGDEWIVTHSQWHLPDEQRFSGFVALSDDLRLRPRPGGFITTAIIEHKPRWIADLSAVEGLGRLAHARDPGIRAALAFPVIVRDEVVTCFEFFAEEVREPDAALLEALPTVASQLARVIERRRAELELQRKAELTQLLTALAVAANEAAAPDDAIQSCLEHICRYGKWRLAHALTLDPDDPTHVLVTSHWRVPDAGRFRAFMASSEVLHYGVHPRGFMTLTVHSRRPVWMADIARHEGYTRRDIALACGLKSAFAFPVLVQDRVAAVLEFFADEVREPDTLFLDAIVTVGSQLARAMERKQALDGLRASEHKLDSILGALEEVVWSMDVRSGRILYLNPAAHKLSGRPVSDFLGSARAWRGIVHPEDQVAVRKGMRELLDRGALVQEFRIVRADGAVRTVENRVHVVNDERGRPQRIDGIMSDVTERKQAEERLTYLAQYDSLTGLPNRNLFRDRLALAMARAKRNGKMLALMFLDLDRFKEINDTLGHVTGDDVLRAVAGLLRESLRDVDTIARLGGDEFTIILENITDVDQAATVAQKIKDALAEPFVVRGREIYVTASIGITLYPRDVEDIDALLQTADVAMYHAKAEGRNTHEFYTPDMNAQAPGRLDVEAQLRRALERHEFLLHYQPRVTVKGEKIVGAEALLRWRNPELGMVSPADFIPLAEENGLIVPIGEWVLASACMQAKAWQRDGRSLAVAVNLSPRQFRQRDLIETVRRALAASGLAPQCLELEITESMIMHHSEQTIATLRRLHDMGVKLSVDDFGTGYSSLSYLKRFPVHTLKVDKSFVREIHQSADDAAIVRAVIALAKNLNLRTVAEGVETRDQLRFLTDLRCDEFQGYYFSRPVPPGDFLRLLGGGRVRRSTSGIKTGRRANKARGRRRLG